MSSKEFITERVKVTEDTQIARLSIAEQLKLLIAHFSPNETEKIKAQRAVVKEATTKRIGCRRLLDALENKMRQSQNRSMIVTIKSGMYHELSEEIKERKSIYKYELGELSAPVELNYDVKLVITRKEDTNEKE